MNASQRPAHLAQLYESYEQARAEFALELAGVFQSRSGLTSWEGVRVLDLGCGSGGIAAAFARLGADVTGIEYDAVRVSKLAGSSLSFKLIAGDGHHLPFKENCFHFVVLADVLEHVYDPAQMMREVARVLCPRGMAFVGATNRTSIVNLLFDPHYNAPLIPLMSKKTATFYVTRLLRFSNSFNVEKYFFRSELVSCLETSGFACQELPLYADKLKKANLADAPGRGLVKKLLGNALIRSCAIRWADTRAFNYLVAPGFNFLCTRL